MEAIGKVNDEIPVINVVIVLSLLLSARNLKRRGSFDKEEKKAIQRIFCTKEEERKSGSVSNHSRVDPACYGDPIREL